MPDKVDAPSKGGWIPLHRKMQIECCKCGLKHEVEVRVKNGAPEWRATPLEAERCPTK